MKRKFSIVVLNKAATRYDPVSFEAGERSMRKRAAALVGAHSDLPATTKINVIKAGFARRLTVSILALPTAERVRKEANENRDHMAER